MMPPQISQGLCAHCRNLNLGGGSGNEEKSFDSGYILKVEPTGCANKLDMGLRERSQG